MEMRTTTMFFFMFSFWLPNFSHQSIGSLVTHFHGNMSIDILEAALPPSSFAIEGLVNRFKQSLHGSFIMKRINRIGVLRPKNMDFIARFS